MTVMRRPISCTNSIAMAFHVPAVSMAMGQKMCVLAKLAYFKIFCCAAWSAAAPGVLRIVQEVTNDIFDCCIVEIPPGYDEALTIQEAASNSQSSVSIANSLYVI